jgi:hypothetical protein
MFLFIFLNIGLNGDRQQFDYYQQNKLSALTVTHWIHKKKHNI